MTFRKWLAIGALTIVYSTVAHAQDSTQCGCVSAPMGAAAIGQVTTAQGDVVMSSRDGFSQASAGQQFGPGTEFILGCEASAAIQVGADCTVALQPGSQVSVVAMDGGGVCVRASEPVTPCGTGAQTGSLQSAGSMHTGVPHFGLPAAIFAGTVGLGAGVGATLGTGESPASP